MSITRLKSVPYALSLLLCMAVLLGLSPRVLAQTVGPITTNTPIVLQRVDFTKPLTFPKFDTLGGTRTLTGVSINITNVSINSDITIVNDSNTASVAGVINSFGSPSSFGSVKSYSIFTFQDPAANFTFSQEVDTPTVGPYTLNPGESLLIPGQQGSASTSASYDTTSPNWAAIAAEFSGTGSVNVNVSTQTYTLVKFSGGNSGASQVTVASATGTITYTFSIPIGVTSTACIEGKIWNDANGNGGVGEVNELGLGGITVALYDAAGTTAILNPVTNEPYTQVTNPNGTFAFIGIATGTYTIKVVAGTLPSGYVETYAGGIHPTQYIAGPPGPNMLTVVAADACGEADFGYVKRNNSGAFTTFTQGGWGSAPHGNNPGTLLHNNFDIVYPSGMLVIGSTFIISFSSADAITAFLPQGGTPAALTRNYTDPTGKITVLAGQLLSVQLAVDFSNAGVTRSGLGAKVVQSGKLAGWTVSQVLALGNAVLGGNLGALPAGVTISDLNTVLDNINQNYDGGSNHGYLN
jgi:hypothetical protein